MSENVEKRLQEIDVDAEALTREEVVAMDKAQLPDPNTQIEAFMDEAWRRQCIREAWETREAPKRPERTYAIPNAIPGETYEGNVRGKYDWTNEEPEFRDAPVNDRAGKG
jgi:hypothetical protein